MKLYESKTALNAADLLNDRVLPFFESQDVPLLRILTDRGSSIAATLSITNTSCTWQLRTSTTPGRRRNPRRPMAFVSGFIARFWRSFTRLPCARNSTTALSSYNRMSMIGLIPITVLVRILDVTAMARPLCKPSSTAKRSCNRRCWSGSLRIR